MTEKIKKTIAALKYTRATRFFIPKNEVLEFSIRSLQAWEEVLQELEEQLHTGKDSNWKNATINAICIIKQKLAEIEE